MKEYLTNYEKGLDIKVKVRRKDLQGQLVEEDIKRNNKNFLKVEVINDRG